MKGQSPLKKQLDVHGKGIAVCKVRLIIIMTNEVYLAKKIVRLQLFENLCWTLVVP